MKHLIVVSGVVLAMAAGAGQASATQVITFDDLPDGTIATNQYPGVIFTGGSVLTEDLSLNPQFPPHSGNKLLYDYADGTITLSFSVFGVTSVGAYITGNTSISESIYSGATLLGTISTGGANYIGSGTGLDPNFFLNLTGANITSAVFTNGEGFGNTFTLDDATIGGANVVGAVPLPAAAPMFGAALLAFGVAGYGLKRKRTAATA